MRKTILTMSLLLLAAASFAIPARRGIWRNITLADGTTVRAELMGDEHLKYYKAENGTLYTISEGTFKPTTIESLSQTASMRRKAASRAGTMRKAQFDNTPKNYRGKKKCLVILAQFTDKKFADSHDNAFYKRMTNESGFSEEGAQGSVRDYFRDQSNGLFDIEFDVAGPYTMPQPYAYYGANNSNGNDMRPGNMVATACKMADADVNFADYDWDGDGEVDQVYVIYAGYGEATSTDANTIWPHMYYLQYSSYGQKLRLDGVTVNTYACGCEIDERNNTNSPHVAGIGTMCHEFSHCLGFPDLYDTAGQRNFGMGPWDLMSSGSYNGDSFCPAGYTSYEKWLAGWLTPIELGNNDTDVSDMKALAAGGNAYIIYNPGNKKEFYMLENRQRTGWDSSLYGQGMIIIHVDYDPTAWTNNSVNTTAGHQRVTIFHADNRAGATTASDIAGDPYPYRDVNSLTNLTTPSAFLHNRNTDGSYYLNKGITDITQNADGTMSFSFKADMAAKPDGGDKDEDIVVFNETFGNCRGKGGNDNTWGGVSGQGSFVPDMNGWTASVANGGFKCALFGNRTKPGTVTSPTFNITIADATIDMALAPWAENTDNVGIYLNDVLQKTVTLKPAQWTTVTLDIDKNGEYEVKLVPTGRLWLDHLTVTEHKKASGIEAIATDTPRRADGRIYTVDGVYVGNDPSALPKGIYIVNGKKFVK